MDPVTHTLVGAGLAQGGLKHRTALATATLLIGANLPDVDVVSYLWGPETALAFRRGLTHGAAALILLPLLLTGCMLLWDRVVRRRRRDSAGAALPSELLKLSFIGVATHPLLDQLNVYGMRWFMPISDIWLYGDTLFILDPWVWGMLGLGVWLGRRKPAWSQRALAAAAFYTVVMAGSVLAGRARVSDLARQQGLAPRRLVLAPAPLTPFTRRVVVQSGDSYHAGTFGWLPRPRLRLTELAYEINPDHPAARRALQEPRVERFLVWARYPYFKVDTAGPAYTVVVGDARYGSDPERSWAATRVRIDLRR